VYDSDRASLSQRSEKIRPHGGAIENKIAGKSLRSSCATCKATCAAKIRASEIVATANTFNVIATQVLSTEIDENQGSVEFDMSNSPERLGPRRHGETKVAPAQRWEKGAFLPRMLVSDGLGAPFLFMLVST
jgi:hypothetical protein